MRLITLTIVLFLASTLYAQETNYWTQNFGSSSYIRGGIEVGGVRTTSAIFYNPGALPFIPGSYFEAQADVFGLDYIFIRNGAGQSLSIESLGVDVVPSFFGLTHKSRKNERLTVAYGSLTRSTSNISITVDQNLVGDFLSPTSESDTYEGTFSYANRARENWLMGALGYALSEKVGIGFSTNITLKTQDFSQYYIGSVYPTSEVVEGNPVFSSLANYSSSRLLTFRSLGFIFKPGINVDLEPIRLGMTITTPNLPLGLLNNRSSNVEIALLPDLSDSTLYLSTTLDKFSGIYETPWIVEMGGEYLFEKASIGATIIWHSKVDPYQMLEAKEASVINGTVFNAQPDFAIPVMAHRNVINFGLAVSVELKENFFYGASFRSDFNYFDDKALSRSENYVPNLTFWDIYHLTSGILRRGPKAELSLGINYGFGGSKNDPQIINMTNISQDNLLQGPIGTNTKTNYHSFGFVFGFNYTIDRTRGLKEEKLE